MVPPDDAFARAIALRSEHLPAPGAEQAAVLPRSAVVSTVSATGGALTAWTASSPPSGRYATAIAKTTAAASDRVPIARLCPIPRLLSLVRHATVQG